MLLDLSEIENNLLETFKNFNQFALVYKLKNIFVNTYNHPYFDHAKFKKLGHNCAIAVKFNQFENVFEHIAIQGNFNEINDLALTFELFFIYFQSAKQKSSIAHAKMLKLYSLFAQFVTENPNSFSNTYQDETNKDVFFWISFNIFPISNMQYNGGMLNVDSNYSNSAYICSQVFKTNIRIQYFTKQQLDEFEKQQKQKEEGLNNATEYIRSTNKRQSCNS